MYDRLALVFSHVSSFYRLILAISFASVSLKTGTALDLWTFNSSNAWQNSISFNYNGSVGIGSTSPGYLLDVNGAARFSVIGVPAGIIIILLTLINVDSNFFICLLITLKN